MSRGTPTTPFRIDPALKAKAQARADREGTNLTAVVVAALEAYAGITTLADGTRVLITWPTSTHHGREGVITSRVADKYRIDVDGGGGTFLRPGEFKVLAPADGEDDQ